MTKLRLNRLRTALLVGASLGAFTIPALAEAAAGEDAANEVVVVTGTREEGRHARESATPIDVVSVGTLAATGTGNVLDALKNTLPAVNAPAVGYDVGALARTFQLRGLSPSHTLVLVDGKRRHLSASIYADSDPAQGSNAVDLDLIPLNAISHIEVLRDGASAQYGSDAIAGVVNIILKDDVDAGSVSVQGGTYYKGDGATFQADADNGFAIGTDGQLHVSVGYRSHGFSNRSGDSGGVQPAKVQGDPHSVLITTSYDYTQPLGADITLYSFATYAARQARAYENPREPGTISDDVDALYPDGFSPQETVNEHDFSITVGLRGEGDWNWDLSSTYGRDNSSLHNIHTVNPDLLADTGNAQSAFSVGGFNSSEWTTNLDIHRGFNIGLAAPLSLSFGVEDRYQTYEIKAGEANSYYEGGPQAFPGFRPTDAVTANRNSAAEYIDVTIHPTESWEVSAAGRAEQYEQVGNRINGKLATRYDISPELAFRASASTGFHAPTLAQQYYSATLVTTGAASIQLPLGTPGAKILGAPNLKPETSVSYSAGVVAEPLSGVYLTADAYRIDVDNRIIESAYLYGDLALAAITANGASIPVGVSSDNAAAVFFTNGVDTRTQGVDVTANTITPLEQWGEIRWDATFSYVETTISHIHAASAALTEAGLTLVDSVQRTNLTTATPKFKASLAANWHLGQWDVTLRNTWYANTTQAQGWSEPYYMLRTGSRVITDLDVGYQLTDHIRLDAGANNLFNIYPDKIAASVYQNLNYDKYSHISPFGINGGSYYMRVSIGL